MKKELQIDIFYGAGIKPFISEIASLRIEIFREYPYLYDGSIDYEKNYLRTYTQSGDSLAVLVFDNDKIVGVSTGLPLRDETDEFQKPFIENGYNPDSIFYCGESILKREYRGQGVYSRFFEEREQHAKKLGGFNTICFCGVVREDNHPLKPNNYQPLDPVWRKFGYSKEPNLTTTYVWKDLNEEKESGKKMVFWVKEI